jgi:superfamily I DNA/RNA helicase
MSKKRGLPYNPSGNFFYDREDMKIAVSAMEYLSGGNPEESLDLDRLNGIREDLYAHHEEMTLRAAFEVACTYTMIWPEGNYLDDEAQILKRTYLDALEHLVSLHEDLSEFLAHIEEARRVNKSSLSGKVTLMTIHQAKGLEFKCVIVPGLNEGILPHINSVEDLANMEEERRLMYVAMTRAMERLIITYRKRQLGHPVTVASRFLGGITE